MSDELYPISEKPTILVDGVELKTPTDPKLKGKTLQVYQFFIENEGDHGIREIQSALNYSSPSVSQYHIQRLLEHDIIIKTDDNRYRLKKDWIRMGSLEDHFRFMTYWIPRTLLYAIFMILLLLTSIFFIYIRVDSYKIWGVVFIPSTLVISLLLIGDTIRLSNKLSQKN